MVPRVRKIDFKMSLQAQPIHASLFIRSTGGVDLRAWPGEEQARAPQLHACMCIMHVIESKSGSSKSLD